MQRAGDTELRIQIKWIYLAAVMGLIILVSKGMPLHNLVGLLGPFVALETMYFFARTIQYGGIFLGAWWMERDLQRTKPSALSIENPDYKPPEPRSGRRRTPH